MTPDPDERRLDIHRAGRVLVRHREHLAMIRNAEQANNSAPFVSFWRDYASCANSLPPAIRMNGLLLAFAMFVEAVEKAGAGKGDLAVLTDLYDGLRMVCGRIGIDSIGKLNLMPTDALEDERKKCCVELATEMRDRLIELPQRDYRLLFEESLSYLVWIKTLANPRRQQEEADDKRKEKLEEKAQSTDEESNAEPEQSDG